MRVGTTWIGPQLTTGPGYYMRVQRKTGLVILIMLTKRVGPKDKKGLIERLNRKTDQENRLSRKERREEDNAGKDTAGYIHDLEALWPRGEIDNLGCR